MRENRENSRLREELEAETHQTTLARTQWVSEDQKAKKVLAQLSESETEVKKLKIDLSSATDRLRELDHRVFYFFTFYTSRERVLIPPRVTCGQANPR